MKKRMVINLGVALFLMLGQVEAFAGSLFEVVSTGTPDAVDITLCLNGKGPLSCQNHHVTALSVNILSTAPNRSYAHAGIRVNTPGYALANLGVDCVPSSNGFCLFSVTDTQAANFSILIDPTSNPTLFSLNARTGNVIGNNFIPGLGSEGSTDITVYGFPLASPGICDTAVTEARYFHVPTTIVSSNLLTIPLDFPNACVAFCHTDITAFDYPGQSASCTNVVLTTL